MTLPFLSPRPARPDAISPAARIAPGMRLGILGCLAAALLVAETTTLRGSLVALLILLAWLPSCRPGWKLVGIALLAFLGLFLSVLAALTLAAWMGEGRIQPILAWGLALKGASLGALAGAILGTFRLGSLLGTFGGLPIPLASLLGQLVQQTFNLVDESRRMVQAMALRAFGTHLPLVLLGTLPQVWLPRVAHRAERVSEAMELRGLPRYRGSRVAPRLGRLDFLALAAAALLLLLSLHLRWGRP